MKRNYADLEILFHSKIHLTKESLTYFFGLILPEIFIGSYFDESTATELLKSKNIIFLEIKTVRFLMLSELLGPLKLSGKLSM